MKSSRGIYVLVAIIAGALAAGEGSVWVAAQGGGASALTGVVSSQEEGKMEGVVVTARRSGANVTVSVVSDARGRYSFPGTHLASGTYAVSIRATGYDLVAPGTVDVAAGRAATLDLKLRKTTDLSAQLTSLEWFDSFPLPDEQKAKMVHQAASCNYCHNYERIVKSKHTAEQFIRVIKRMQSYYPDGTAAGLDRATGRDRGRGQLEPHHVERSTWGYAPGIDVKELAGYLAAINLSGGKTTWPYELKVRPRPKGLATKVIITQWDMPRKDTVSHDMDVTPDGTPWYTDESRMFVGKLNPKTNTFTEFPLPDVPKGDLPGARDIVSDKDGNLWFPMRVAGGSTIVVKFDAKTETITRVAGSEGGQFMAVGADGKIWSGFRRIDPKTMKVEAQWTWDKAPNLPPGPHGGYADLVAVNSKGDPYMTDFVGSYIVSIDTKTGAARFHKPLTTNSMPRRGKMDAQDRFWFSEYTGDRVAMLDTKTHVFKEWFMGRFTTPYTVSVPDKKGYVYASSNMTESLMRLDPKTGDIVSYLMPTVFDSKKIAHDPTTATPTIWMANTRFASIIRVEPID